MKTYIFMGKKWIQDLLPTYDYFTYHECRMTEDVLLEMGATLQEDPKPIERVEVDLQYWDGDGVKVLGALNKVIDAVNTLLKEKR